jgi:hypothetical protein
MKTILRLMIHGASFACMGVLSDMPRLERLFSVINHHLLDRGK